MSVSVSVMRFLGIVLVVLSALSGLAFGQTDLAITQTAYHHGGASNLTTFTISVTNNGPNDATNVVVTDNLNASWNFNNPATNHSVSAGTLGYSGTANRNLTWSIPLIRNGETAVLVFSAVNNYADWQIPSPFNNANTATITAMDQTDPVAGNNNSTINTTLEWNDHNLSVTKSASNVNPTQGSLVQFTITVAKVNGGNGVNVQVTDKLPPGFTFQSATASAGSYNSSTGIWNLGLTSYNFSSHTLTINAIANTPGTFTNTVFISHGGPDTDVSNNIASVTVVTQAAVIADLAVTKTVNEDEPMVGSDVTFTIEVENLGPEDATGVSVTDQLPDGYTYVSHNTATGSYNPGTGIWTIGNINNGNSVSLNIIATVLASGNYTNTASVTANESDTEPLNNNSSTSVTPVFPEADLEITKDISNPTPGVGSNVVFTIVVKNKEGDNAMGVLVNDLLPDGFAYVSHTATNGNATYVPGTGVWTIGELDVDDQETLTITATVLPSGNYTNMATVTGGVDDPVPGNNSASAGLTNILDLGITKTVDEDEPLLGTNVVFTVTATNHGSGTATGVVISDAIPSGYDFVGSTEGTYNPANRTVTWNAGNLATSANASFTITVKVKGSGNYHNTATVSANEPDHVPGNNSAARSVNPDMTNALDLKVVQSVSTETPNIGNNVTFTITATNQNASVTSGVIVNSLLGNGLQFVSATPSVGSYSSGSWTIGNMAASATETITIVATVLGDVGAAYLSIAEITANEIDLDNNIINNKAYSILSPVGQDFHPCDVNAEEPAFEEDFGSGASPYGPELIVGRTNMVFQTGVNIQDGEYTIAKNAQLGYTNWADITDPSGDPNGYFMILNAGIEPHEFFRTRITLSEEFCTNTRYNINFKVINVNSTENYDYCENNEGGLILPEIGYFVVNDKGQILGAGTSGTIPYNAIPEWIAQQFVFVSGMDDEWVELVLFNKAPGGCGNDLAIDDITVYACMTPPIRLDMTISGDKEEVCGGETITMEVNFDTEGNYVWPPEAWGGGDSTSMNVEYQWQRSDDGVNYTDIAGQTTHRLIITEFGPEDQAYYRLMYAQAGNINKVFCRFPSNDFYPVFNATPIPGPIQTSVDEDDLCVDSGPFQFSSEYDFTGYPTFDEEDPYYIWQSSNTSVATIDQNGLLSPVTPGTVTITYLVRSRKGECWGSVTRTVVIRDENCNLPPAEPKLIITNPMLRSRAKGGG